MSDVKEPEVKEPELETPLGETVSLRRFTPLESADGLAMYLLRRREILIIELRELDRLLGREQTIPTRGR